MNQDKKVPKKGIYDTRTYCRTEMKKELILERLKEKGFRLTSQREILIDIILQEQCTSCKEIYYKALKMDSQIGIATVYRMINILEEINAINRQNMYKLICSQEVASDNVCIIELENNIIYHLTSKEWYEVVKKGLEVLGYNHKSTIRAITVKECHDKR